MVDSRKHIDNVDRIRDQFCPETRIIGRISSSLLPAGFSTCANKTLDSTRAEMFVRHCYFLKKNVWSRRCEYLITIDDLFCNEMNYILMNIRII